MIPIDENAIETAIARLRRSERGTAALAALVAMLDDGAVSLDSDGQRAVFTLLYATWTGEFRSSARDMMREAVPVSLRSG